MSTNPVQRLLRQSHCDVLSKLVDALNNVASSCSEVISVTDKRTIFANIKEIVAVHQELGDIIASNPSASFASLGSTLSSFLFFSNFISAHVDYAKTRPQSTVALQHLTQANKKFASLIEGGKGALKTAGALEAALDAPLTFVSRLRAVITSASVDSDWSSKESKTWLGIEKNLQRICRDEENEATKRGLENKLFQLELRILELPDKIHRRGRYLIDQLPLLVSVAPRNSSTSPTQGTKAGSNSALKSKFTELVVVLINDLLLLLKRSKSQKGMFVFKQQQNMTQLLHAELANLPTTGEATLLKLTFPEFVFLLKFEAQSIAEKWHLETIQHVPNSGARTDRNAAAESAIRSPNRSSPSSPTTNGADTSEASSPERHERKSDKYGSDRDDSSSASEQKKRKKRSTSSNHQAVPKLQFAMPASTASPSSSSTASPNDSKRTPTSVKRSNFMKSLSVSTITSEIQSAPRSLPKLRLSKQRSNERGDTVDIVPLGTEGNSCSTDTHKKRKTDSKPQGKTAAETSPAEIRRVEPAERFGDLPVRSVSAYSATHIAAPLAEPPKNKYLLHPVLTRQGSVGLENSSDYEESEDEPARYVSPVVLTSGINGQDSSFFKPLPRGTGVTVAGRNLESKSLRDLRSGSVDDLSARDPPTAAEFGSGSKILHQSLSATSVQQVGTPSSLTSESNQTQAESHYSSYPSLDHSSESTDQATEASSHKQLDVALIVSTIRRMESDLALLKRALADAGVHC